ncbi:MAG: VWA domain-containing protein [Isosphaeraceae bacterium]
MSIFEYAAWDDSQDPTGSNAESIFDKLAEYMMSSGDEIWRSIDTSDEDTQEILELIRKEGLIEKDSEGRFRVTARGLRRIEQSALSSLFQSFNRDAMGKHDTAQKGAGSVVLEESKPYEYGDNLAHLNLHETMRNAIGRRGAGTPVRLEQDDFVVYETEFQTSCSTVVLIDMSGSMNRFGKYAMTKQVALGLLAMVRAQYPGDKVMMVGFYSYASPMTERELLNSAPKPVSLFDPRVHLRISLDQPSKKVPQHFTNIHAGLKLARNMLSRETTPNKQVILITDGEPTAHIEGRDLLLIYPPSPKTAAATLTEARRCAAAGIRVSSFALVEDYYYFGLVNFVGELARVTRGVAGYCTAEQLGQAVFENFTTGRKQRQVKRLR